MKPSARIQATIEILERVAANTRVPMDASVGDYMRQRRYIGSKDRADVAERVYNMTRAHARLGWWLEKLDVEDTPRARVICWLVLSEGADEKRFKDLFDGTQYAPAPLDEAGHKAFASIIGQTISHDDQPEAIRVECPTAYEGALRDYFGDAFAEEMTAMLSPATLDLRVNSFVMKREDVQRSLDKDGVKTTDTPMSPWGLRCETKAYITKTKAMNKGWIEIQDEGSQMISYLCEARPGMQVLDFCAGGGGKTLALAAAMQKKGRVVAMDNNSRRLEKGRRRYKKAGIADIIEVRSLEDEKQRKWFKRQNEKFDIVLTDVPCSGTGTWRRNPDMRWTHYGPTLEELVQIQGEIMDKACTAVKVGGRLVYATCSLLKDENENQIEAFLARHPEFELAPIEESRGLGSPYMRLTPHRHNTDGFFTAILVKKTGKEQPTPKGEAA
jgi:16S rRNA (cytosine967-C5)-methyltransferase